MPVFVSHSHKDEAVYSAMCLAFNGAGIDRWEVSQMSLGESLADQLRLAISDCELCVFIATRRSIESQWCLAELGAFWGAEKNVIIFLADPDLEDSVLPPQFRGNLTANDASRLIEAVKETLEHAPRGSQTSISTVKDPKGLLVSTPDFEHLGAADDFKIAQDAFPFTHLSNATSEGSLASFRNPEYSIIHFVGEVSAANGSLVFTQNDLLSAEGFSKLIEVSKPDLVILASCDSLLLAAKLAKTTNMISATGSVSVDDIVAWEKCFYELLARGEYLSQAFDVATASTEAPMLLLMNHDIQFRTSNDTGNG